MLGWNRAKMLFSKCSRGFINIDKIFIWNIHRGVCEGHVTCVYLNGFYILHLHYIHTVFLNARSVGHKWHHHCGTFHLHDSHKMQEKVLGALSIGFLTAQSNTFIGLNFRQCSQEQRKVNGAKRIYRTRRTGRWGQFNLCWFSSITKPFSFGLINISAESCSAAELIKLIFIERAMFF